MKRKKEMGRQAEDLAAQFLQSKGWRVIDRNWACHVGELDLVLHRGDTTLFVEVRSTVRGDLDTLHHTVNRTKQRKVAGAAEVWLTTHPTYLGTCRFDVLTLKFDENGHSRIRHYPDAFQSPWAF